MMEDFEAMNHKTKLTTRQQILRGPNTGTAELIDWIQEKEGGKQRTNTFTTSPPEHKCNKAKQHRRRIHTITTRKQQSKTAQQDT